jgi:hypothetical protein
MSTQYDEDTDLSQYPCVALKTIESTLELLRGRIPEVIVPEYSLTKDKTVVPLKWEDPELERLLKYIPPEVVDEVVDEGELDLKIDASNGSIFTFPKVCQAGINWINENMNSLIVDEQVFVTDSMRASLPNLMRKTGEVTFQLSEWRSENATLKVQLFSTFSSAKYAPPLQELEALFMDYQNLGESQLTDQAKGELFRRFVTWAGEKIENPYEVLFSGNPAKDTNADLYTLQIQIPPEFLDTNSTSDQNQEILIYTENLKLLTSDSGSIPTKKLDSFQILSMDPKVRRYRLNLDQHTVAEGIVTLKFMFSSRYGKGDARVTVLLKRKNVLKNDSLQKTLNLYCHFERQLKFSHVLRLYCELDSLLAKSPSSSILRSFDRSLERKANLGLAPNLHQYLKEMIEEKNPQLNLIQEEKAHQRLKEKINVSYIDFMSMFASKNLKLKSFEKNSILHVKTGYYSIYLAENGTCKVEYCESRHWHRDSYYQEAQVWRGCYYAFESSSPSVVVFSLHVQCLWQKVSTNAGSEVSQTNDFASKPPRCLYLWFKDSVWTVGSSSELITALKSKTVLPAAQTEENEVSISEQFSFRDDYLMGYSTKEASSCQLLASQDVGPHFPRCILWAERTAPLSRIIVTEKFGLPNDLASKYSVSQKIEHMKEEKCVRRDPNNSDDEDGNGTYPSLSVKGQQVSKRESTVSESQPKCILC